MRIIFMSSGKIGVEVLKRLIKDGGHEIVAVYTTEPRVSSKGRIEVCEVYEIAKNEGLRIITPRSFKDDLVKEEFLGIEHEIVIVVSYGFLLPDYVLYSGKYCAINVHPSALPRWRGAAPVERSVEAGDRDSEICIMFMAAKLDAGDVLMRKGFEIDEWMNSGDVYEIINREAGGMVLEVLDGLEKGGLKGEVQIEEGVIYAKKILKSELEIRDFENLRVMDVFNRIRAFSTYGYCFVLLNGERVKIIEAGYEIIEGIEEFGIKEGFRVFCKDGVILPKRVQREGRGVVGINDFLRGWKGCWI